MCKSALSYVLFYNAVRMAILLNCNCNYILFTKLPWPGDDKGTFWSSLQTATCPQANHTQRRLHTVPLISECQSGSYEYQYFSLWFEPTLIEPESTVSVADALSTQPLID